MRWTPPGYGGERRAPEHVGPAENRVQGGAQLVRHRGEERLARAARFLGDLACLPLSLVGFGSIEGGKVLRT